MATGISLADTWEFSLPNDSTTWILGYLDGLLMLKLLNEKDPSQFIIGSVQFGLKGWKNFKNAKGEEILFRSKKEFLYGEDRLVVDQEVLKVIPTPILTALGWEIANKQRLGEDEKKN